MEKVINYPLTIKKLNANDKIPYELLLLADETIDAINKYIFDSELHVVELEGKIIAIYVLFPINEQEMEIKNIAVKHEYQNQGIGKFLLQDAMFKGKEKKIKFLIIGTASTAIKQLKLYKGVGFKPFGTKKDFFIINYPKAIIEDGMQLKDMIMLRKELV